MADRTPAQILETLVDPSATDETVATAVQTFNARVEAASSSPSSVADCLWDAYSAVSGTARRATPEQQGKLLDFMAQLRRTTAAGADGRPLRSADDGGEIWTDLPMFGWHTRDLFNTMAYDPQATDAQRTAAENLSGFLAQLHARSVWNGATFALWQLREAFEEPPPQGPHGDWPATLAACWVLFAGDQLRRLSANGEPQPARMGVAGSKYADRDWKGFTEERWQAWKEGFKAAREVYPSNDRIHAAANRMDKL